MLRLRRAKFSKLVVDGGELGQIHALQNSKGHANCLDHKARVWRRPEIAGVDGSVGVLGREQFVCCRFNKGSSDGDLKEEDSGAH